MDEEKEKKEFLDRIHEVPFWVKHAEDLKKFCIHLQYRLMQTKKVNDWYQNNFELSDKQEMEVLSIVNIPSAKAEGFSQEQLSPLRGTDYF